MALPARPQSTALAEELRLVVGAATDVGGRQGNEDAVHVAELPSSPTAEAGYLLAVADGMGGHARGEVASRLAIEALARSAAEDTGADAAFLLKQAFRRANDAIYRDGGDEAADQAMGTTLVAAMLRGKYATIASVGDSRAYLLRANAVTQVTKDHSLVAEQVAKGSLSAGDARRSPQRNVLTHALGQRPKLDAKLPGVFELTLLPEDRLLLCTDGFYDVVEDADFAQILLAHPPQDAAKRLVDLAVERGTADNVSAVVAEALPTRIPTIEISPDGTTRTRPGFSIFPLLAAVAAILFVALVILALTLL
ncbi:MAG: protein phosphatase 2C domain-containing protein [Chloroflexota bacterium]|nr:protein phosphatase 2C domain-containing protein [Chloroflexota bacterium]